MEFRRRVEQGEMDLAALYRFCFTEPSEPGTAPPGIGGLAAVFAALVRNHRRGVLTALTRDEPFRVQRILAIRQGYHAKAQPTVPARCESSGFHPLLLSGLNRRNIGRLLALVLWAG